VKILHIKTFDWVWWHMLVILELGRLRLDGREFEVSLGDIVNSRSACVMRICLKKKNKKTFWV
jgi:hypothetical protein